MVRYLILNYGNQNYRVMNKSIQQLETFFDEYAQRVNQALNDEPSDIDATVNSFANCFIESSPLGVICGKNDKDFRKNIAEGYVFYRSIGITSMDIVSKEITALDAYHNMTKIHWKTNFVRKDGSKGSIKFDVIYFTWSIDEEHKIFSYITGDEQKALEEKGLIP